MTILDLNKPLYSPEQTNNGWVYVLDCLGGYYYIGFSRNLHRRLKQHFSDYGAKFTQRHKPLSLLYYSRGDLYEEGRITRFWRDTMGRDSVCGGSYNNFN